MFQPAATQLLNYQKVYCLSNSGQYSGKSLLKVFFAVLIGAFSLGNAAPSLQEFAVARGAAAFVFQVIDRIPPVDTLSEQGVKPKSMSGSVQFKKVAFAYPARKDTPILRSLSFHVEAGETVAFVGPSGYASSCHLRNIPVS